MQRTAGDTRSADAADEIAAGAGAVTGIGGKQGDYAGNLEAQRAIDDGSASDTLALLKEVGELRVHRESVARIQDYQDCLNRHDPAGAEAIARQYQEGRLGYDGIAFHFAATLGQLDGLTLEWEPAPAEAHLPPLASVSAPNHPARSLPSALPSPPV